MTWRSVLRQVGAGVLGFVIFVAGSTLVFYIGGYDPHARTSLPFQLFSVGAGIVFALIAGYITAASSHASDVRPVIMVALLIGVSATLSLLSTQGVEAWSQLSALFLMAPAVVIGGRMRRRQVQRGMQPQHGAVNGGP